MRVSGGEISLFGITAYRFTVKSFKQLIIDGLALKLIKSLKLIKGKKYATPALFPTAVENVIGKNSLTDYREN